MLFLSLSSNQGCDSLGSPCFDEKKHRPFGQGTKNNSVIRQDLPVEFIYNIIALPMYQKGVQTTRECRCIMWFGAYSMFSAHGLERTSSKAWARRQQKSTFDGGKTLGIRRFGVKNSHQLLVIIHRDSEGWKLKVMT